MPSSAPKSIEQYESLVSQDGLYLALRLLTWTGCHQLRSRPLIVVCFYAIWSLPCNQFLPTYERYSNHPNYSMFDFYKVDCDFEPMIKKFPEGRPNERSIETVRHFAYVRRLTSQRLFFFPVNYQQIPVCLVFKNGVKVDQEVGPNGFSVDHFKSLALIFPH